MSENTYDFEQTFQEMSRHMFDVVNGVQECREIRPAAFKQAESLGHELTRVLRGRDMVPRKILLALNTAAGILENEAPYSQDEQGVRAISQSFRRIFHLILNGECQDERKPGVPRVI